MADTETKENLKADAAGSPITDDPDETKTIALLGATGKVGGWVFESLLDQKYNVRVLVRKASKLDAYKDRENLTILEGSCLEKESTAQLVTGCDVIISCLGSPSPQMLLMQKAAEVLVSALKEVDDAALPRVVWISTVGVNDATIQGHHFGCSNGCCPSCCCCCGYGCNGMMMFCCLIPCVMTWDLWNDLGYAEDVLFGDDRLRNRTVIARSCNMWPADGGGATFSKEWRETGGAPDMMEYQTTESSANPPAIWIRRQALAKFFVDAVEDTQWDGQAVSVFPNY